MTRIQYYLILFLLNVFVIYTNVSVYASNNNGEQFRKVLQKAISYKNINSDSVIYYANQAFLIAYENKNPNQKLNALSILANQYIRTGKSLKALSLCDTLKKISANNNLQHFKPEILIIIGNVYQSIGFSSESLEFFFEALNSSNPSISIKDRIDSYYYIALVYYELTEIDECQKYLKLSLREAISHELPMDAFPPYLLYANSFNQTDSVYKYIQLADNILDDYPKLTYEKVVVLGIQALLNKGLGNYDISNIQYLEAIAICKSNGYRESISNLYNNYAYLLMAESKYDSAKIVLTKSLSIAKELKIIDLQASIYDSYSDYYSAIGNYKMALAYQDSSITKENQYREQQQIQKSLFLSAVFETEQKEKEILQQENEITQLWVYMLSVVAVLAIAIGLVVYFKQKYSLGRSRMDALEKGKSLEIADALIHGQDAERKRLAMDLHDGLGARLGTLRLIVDGFFKPHEKYDEVSNSITTIHQNVRELSHRMLPTQLERLGLIMTIKSMVSSINKSDKFIVRFETNIKKRLTDKLEVNLYYLIYEMINNATRHSNGNTIFVQLFEDDNLLNLSVEDNGNGFKQDNNHSGIGLKNIKTRVEYLGGSFIVDSNDSATIFMIEIPLPKRLSKKFKN